MFSLATMWLTSLQYILALRKDLERVRMITEIARKREDQKLRQAQIVQELLSNLLYPHDLALHLAFEKIVR